MNRKFSISVIVVSLLVISQAANAQGRPSSAGQSAGNQPSMSQQRDMSSMRLQADARRQEAEAKQMAAEAKRLEADARKAEAGAVVEEFGQSVAMRAAHPPNSNAADEALRAVLNADDNLALQDNRPALAGENRREHGGGDPDDGDDD